MHYCYMGIQLQTQRLQARPVLRLTHGPAAQLGNMTVFYKQRDNLYFPVSAYVLPTSALRVPYSVVFGFLWASIVYWAVGMDPSAGRWGFYCRALCAARYRRSVSLTVVSNCCNQKPTRRATALWSTCPRIAFCTPSFGMLYQEAAMQLGCSIGSAP